MASVQAVLDDVTQDRAGLNRIHKDSPISLGRVLIIDAELATRETVAAFFTRHNAAPTFVSDQSQVLKQVDSGGFSLVILGHDLRIQDGLALLRRIRQRSEIPVIIVSAEPRDEIDRVIGLELGADDYVSRPVGLHELLARARATLRRQEVGRQSLRQPLSRGGYRFAGWEVRRKTRVLLSPKGEIVSLTKSEYALLVTLLEASGRVLSREQLLQATRNRDDIYDRSIDVQVLRLRRKMESSPTGSRVILTERGLGYRVGVQVEPFY